VNVSENSVPVGGAVVGVGATVVVEAGADVVVGAGTVVVAAVEDVVDARVVGAAVVGATVVAGAWVVVVAVAGQAAGTCSTSSTEYTFWSAFIRVINAENDGSTAGPHKRRAMAAADVSPERTWYSTTALSSSTDTGVPDWAVATTPAPTMATAASPAMRRRLTSGHT
jgi:hypothetical protein